MAEKHAESALRTLDLWERVEAQWGSRTPKMDWLGMETALRDFLRRSREHPELGVDHVRAGMSEIIAAWTRRGSP
jgi:hypothetical protein